jgi:hypothetical protein
MIAAIWQAICSAYDCWWSLVVWVAKQLFLAGVPRDMVFFLAGGISGIIILFSGILAFGVLMSTWDNLIRPKAETELRRRRSPNWEAYRRYDV